MRIAPLADVKARLSAYLEDDAREGPIVITRNGKAVALLLAPYDADDLESLVLSRSPRLRALGRVASCPAWRNLNGRWNIRYNRAR
jgi:prevent-host-death family protein